MSHVVFPDVAPAPQPSSVSRQALFAPLQQPLPAVRAPLFYRAAVMASAGVLLVLPLLYAAVVISLTAVVLDYVVSHVLLLSAGETIGVVLAYVIPGIVLLVALLLVIKPAFHVSPRDVKPQVLSRKLHPLLFEYIDQLCKVLHTPRPHRVQVDLSCNASVSYAGIGGFFSRKLVLTLGLSLVRAMDIRGLSGILAHELGHFAQRRGLSMHTLIMMINGWFARVVYERDAFDYWVYRLSLPGLGPLRLPFYAARGLMSVGRRVLWLFMMMAHAATCYISRRDEYDADRYAAHIAGSDAVGAMLQQTTLVSLSLDATLDDMAESWRQGRLGDDLSLLAVSKASRLSSERREQVIRLVRAERTAWHSTHPSMLDRVNAAKRLQCQAMVTSAQAATQLFKDFDKLCRDNTIALYRARLGDEFTEKNLVPAEQLVRELAEIEAAHDALRRFYQGEPLVTRPIFPNAEADSPPAYPEQTITALAFARQQMLDSADQYEKAARKYVEVDDEVRALVIAELLQAVGFQINPREFGLTRTDAAAIRRRKQAIMTKRDRVVNNLEPLEDNIVGRLTCALQLLRDQQVREAFDRDEYDALRTRADRLLAVAMPLRDAAALGQKLGEETTAMMVLLQNMDVTNISGVARNAINARTSKVRQLMEQLRNELATAPYPFEHIAGRIDIGRYLVEANQPPAHPKAKALPPAIVTTLAAMETLERLDGLVVRVLAHLANIAERVETAVDIEAAANPVVKDEFAMLVEQTEKEAGSRRRTDSALAYPVLPQLASAAVVALFVFLFAFGARQAGPHLSVKLPHHPQYQTSIVPIDWVAPTPTRVDWSNPNLAKMPDPYAHLPEWARPDNVNNPWGHMNTSNPGNVNTPWAGRSNFNNINNNINNPRHASSPWQNPTSRSRPNMPGTGRYDPRGYDPRGSGYNNPNDPNRYRPTQPGRQPNRPSQPGYNPNRRPSRPSQPGGYRPSRPSNPSRPGPSRPSSPSRPGGGGYRPGGGGGGYRPGGGGGGSPSPGGFGPR